MHLKTEIDEKRCRAHPLELSFVVVSSNYPSRLDPTRGTFVADLVQAWRSMTVHVNVVAPEKYCRAYFKPAASSSVAHDLFTSRPRYLSFSTRIPPVGLSTYQLTEWFYTRAVERAALYIRDKPNLVYSHFLGLSGSAAIRLASRWRVPAFVALGESSYTVLEQHFDIRRLQRLASQFAGAICVSRENQFYAIDRLKIPPEKTLLAPNATDPRLFTAVPREVARRRLGLPHSRFIVAFVGSLTERKGPLRVLQAIRGIPEAGVVFCGQGPQNPKGEQVLHCGPIEHDKLALWLSACDAFALPTRAEGCCNAVNEALACGLPVVASDIPQLDDQLADGRGLRIAADDVVALEVALRQLACDEGLRARMRASALKWSARLTLDYRAKSIAQWMRRIMEGIAE